MLAYKGTNMKKIIAIIATAFAFSALAAEPAKQEVVKKPAVAASAPATPKEMPKVEKPAKKEVKKVDASKSTKPEDKKAEAAKK
jgi:PBP1b-binding outer membrane lipoprotein LpoB